MNIYGFKQILVAVNSKLHIRVYNEQMKIVFYDTIEEFMKDSRYDMLKFRWFSCSMNDIEIPSPENFFNNFTLNIGTEDLISLEKTIQIRDLVERFEGKLGQIFYRDLLDPSILDKFKNPEKYTKSELEEAEDILERYMDLPVKFIKLTFDKNKFFEEIIEPDVLDKYFSIYAVPELPLNMSLFY